MGYYTDYSISTDSSEHNETIIEEIIKISGYSDPFEESCKWYAHEEHIKEISLKYPNVLITINGRGEEQPDTWRKYFKNGKHQLCTAILTYPDYDESKLI